MFHIVQTIDATVSQFIPQSCTGQHLTELSGSGPVNSACGATASIDLCQHGRGVLEVPGKTHVQAQAED